MVDANFHHFSVSNIWWDPTNLALRGRVSHVPRTGYNRQETQKWDLSISIIIICNKRLTRPRKHILHILALHI